MAVDVFTDANLANLKEWLDSRGAAMLNTKSFDDFLGALIHRLEAAEHKASVAQNHIGICPEFELADIAWRRAAGK